MRRLLPTEALTLARIPGSEADAVAFPSLSTGAYGYPVFEASKIAVDAIWGFLNAHEKPTRVLLVAFDDRTEKALRRTLGAHEGDAADS